MRTEDLILVSVDDHVVEPPNLFEGHVSDAMKDRAPAERVRTRAHPLLRDPAGLLRHR
jgi:hypothetical protein